MLIKEYNLNAIYQSFGVGAYVGAIIPDEVYSKEFISTVTTGHVPRTNCIDESQFEYMIHLAVLEDMKEENITFMELGAGFGGQSLSIHGAVKNSVIPMNAKNVKCIAIEAEAMHYQWLQDAFRLNGVIGLTILGAVADSLGYHSFCAPHKPQDHYGQSLNDNHETYKVPCFTLDYLFERFGWSKVNYIDMDVQEAEIKVLQGGMKILSERKVDYIKIGTHKVEFSQQIKELVGAYYDVIIDLPPFSNEHVIDGFSLPIYIPNDGIMLLKRKGS